MKAVVLEGINKALEYKEVASPIAGAGEAIVKIHAAAFNHRDLWIKLGKYAGLKFPIILGSDGCGMVVSSPNPTQLGKTVIINPSLDWGNDPRAQGRSFRILGLPDDGTFAEFVKIPAVNLVEKPAHLDHLQAAALPLAGVTAYRSLFTRAQLKAGERVLITGIGGGVALFALQFALAAGAKVYVTSGSDTKLERAQTLGASGGSNYHNSNWAEVLKALAGAFDVIVDSAGGAGFSKLTDLAAPAGRLVFFGATQGNPSELAMRQVFWKQLSLLGSTMGTDADFADMVRYVNDNKITPVVDQVFDLANAETAIQRMANLDQFGKIVLEV